MTQHGMSYTRIYNIWQKIVERCCNSKSKSYQFYGAKGITISEEWKNSFEQFYKDMGERPDVNYQVDRIDNSKGYSKDNCRWATPSEQSRNRKTNICINWEGEKRLLIDVAEELEVSKKDYLRAIRRYSKKWDHADLFVPAGYFGFHGFRINTKENK